MIKIFLIIKNKLPIHFIKYFFLIFYIGKNFYKEQNFVSFILLFKKFRS